MALKGFHKEGRASIVLVTLISAAAVVPSFYFDAHVIIKGLAIALALFLMTAILQFFRVPKRNPTVDDGAVISPADGKIVVIEKVFEKEYLQEECTMISVFMSPLNVHINWFPINGEVSYHKYHPGKFLVAFNPKSSELNERNTLAVKGEKGEVLFRQIAGAVARRICYYPKVGDKAAQGNQFGFIKFGSRVDLFIPTSAEVKVKIGDVVKGSITELARF